MADVELSADLPYGPVEGAVSYRRPTRPHSPKEVIVAVQTDYIHHAARLARQIHLDAAMGGSPQPDAEFYKTLAKALNDIAEGLDAVSKRRD